MHRKREWRLSGVVLFGVFYALPAWADDEFMLNVKPCPSFCQAWMGVAPKAPAAGAQTPKSPAPSQANAASAPARHVRDRAAATRRRVSFARAAVEERARSWRAQTAAAGAPIPPKRPLLSEAPNVPAPTGAPIPPQASSEPPLAPVANVVNGDSRVPRDVPAGDEGAPATLVADVAPANAADEGRQRLVAAFQDAANGGPDASPAAAPLGSGLANARPAPASVATSASLGLRLALLSLAALSLLGGAGLVVWRKLRTRVRLESAVAG